MQEAQRLQRLLQEVQSRHAVDATPAQESVSPRVRERGVSAEPQPRGELRGPAQDGAGPATEDRLRELEERHAQALQDAHDQIQSLQDERQKVWQDAKVRIRSLQDKLDKALQVAEDPVPPYVRASGWAGGGGLRAVAPRAGGKCAAACEGVGLAGG